MLPNRAKGSICFGNQVLAKKQVFDFLPLEEFSQADAPTQLNSFFFSVEAHLLSFPVLEETIQGLS